MQKMINNIGRTTDLDLEGIADPILTGQQISIKGWTALLDEKVYKKEDIETKVIGAQHGNCTDKNCDGTVSSWELESFNDKDSYIGKLMQEDIPLVRYDLWCKACWTASPPIFAM